MKAKNKKANFIIVIIVGLLLILILVMQLLIVALKQEEKDNIVISKGDDSNIQKQTTVKEIIENAGSQYIDMTEGVFIKIYANFKYDLYDENGKSKKAYFVDIIDKIADLKKDTFYLIDNEKNIEIFVQYDKEKDRYTIKFNDIENFYDTTDGDTYTDISKTKIVQQNAFGVMEDIYATLQTRGMYFANSVIVTSKREELPNGYYYYPEEHIKAKLGGAKVLNLLYDKEFENQIATNVYVTTKLEEVEKRYPNPGFGSPREGYLGYRSSTVYTFLYEDEVSLYPYNYQENSYFDEYLEEYCKSGNLNKLVSDFTTRWSNYFEFEYDEENQNLKLTFPTRGIAMDIHNNDSKGITIYNNYYLTDTVKELIKNNKITLEPDKDLVLITEQNRRESMK